MYNGGMEYLAVLGRLPEVSMAEVEAVFGEAKLVGAVAGAKSEVTAEMKPGAVAVFKSEIEPEIDRFGGVMKFAKKLNGQPLEYLRGLPEGKITIGVSDYSRGASRKAAAMEALRLKKILVRHGRSVRVVENKEAVLSTATSLHNGLSGKNERKIELIKLDLKWYRVVGVQDIDAYAKRDQARPARDARVGMLPPKLAQILINLCGPLPEGAAILDPFCGTGVVLQEALLMGYFAYGTDISEKMVEYTKKNLKWFLSTGSADPSRKAFRVSKGDAMNFRWERPISAVACEGYLGRPMSQVPTEMALKREKQECGAIVLGCLENLVGQIEPGTPVVIAVPAWLRPDGVYERLEIIDNIMKMGYNVNNKSREGLLYYRKGQIVARDIIILRKK